MNFGQLPRIFLAQNLQQNMIGAGQNSGINLNQTNWSGTLNAPILTGQIDIKRLSNINQALSRRDISFDGKFGADPIRFSDQLEEAKEFLSLSEDEIFRCLPTFLKNDATDWWRLKRKEWRTFGDFLAAFLQ